MKKQVQFRVLLDILVSVNDDLKQARDDNNTLKIGQFLDDIQGLATHLNRLIDNEKLNEILKEGEL